MAREVECDRCGGMVNPGGCLDEKCPVGNPKHKAQVKRWQADEAAKAAAPPAAPSAPAA